MVFPLQCSVGFRLSHSNLLVSRLCFFGEIFPDLVAYWCTGPWLSVLSWSLRFPCLRGCYGLFPRFSIYDGSIQLIPHVPGRSLDVSADVVHDLYVDMSIYGVIFYFYGYSITLTLAIRELSYVINFRSSPEKLVLSDPAKPC